MKLIFQIVTKKFSERDPTDEILRAFKLFDEDNNGEYKMFLMNIFKVLNF